MSNLSSANDYTQFLIHPDDKAAFMAGCRAMIDVFATSAPDDLAFLTSNTTDDRLIALLRNQQRTDLRLQHDDARSIIYSCDLDRTDVRAMILGFYTNSDGYATNENGEVIEDPGYALEAGCARRPWPYTLAKHKHTGQQIPREEYDNLPAELQEEYDVLRYLDFQDENGATIRRVTQDEKVYMEELLIWDIEHFEPNAYRYLTMCGSGHGPFPQGELYDYRKVIADTVKGLLPTIATQVKAGYINSSGQYYLAWLQALKVDLTPLYLREMEAYQLDLLEMLFVNPNYFITDDDIIYYRNAEGNGMPGAIEADLSWEQLPASDERCEIDAQGAYLQHVLIPKVCANIVQCFDRSDNRTTINMKVSAMRELFDLIDAIAIYVITDEDEDDEQPEHQPPQEE